MALVFLLGALFGPRVLPESAVAAEKRTVPPKVIQAQAFQVVDAHGTVRAVLQMKADYPILSLYDRKKQSRVDMWLCEDDPVLQMAGDDGNDRLELSVNKASAGMLCYDKNRHTRVAIGVVPYGKESAYIQLRDAQQNSALFLEQDDFTNRISCSDTQGELKAELCVDKDTASFAFYNQHKPSLQLLDGTPFTGLALFQPDKQRRAWYGLEQGIPTFGLQDAAGARRLEGALTPEGARLRALDEKGALTGAWPGK